MKRLINLLNPRKRERENTARRIIASVNPSPQPNCATCNDKGIIIRGHDGRRISRPACR